MEKSNVLLASTLVAVSLTTAAYSDDFPFQNDQMSFALAKPDRACDDCVWIAADGKITNDTPSQFLAFLSENGDQIETGMVIHLNSEGGDIRGALRMADLIRVQGFSTTVSKSHGLWSDGFVTVAQSNDLSLVNKEPEGEEQAVAVCATECLLLFAAGVERYAHPHTDPGFISGQPIGELRLGLLKTSDVRAHIKAPVSLSTPREPVHAGQLLDLFTSLGVSSELFQMVRAMPLNQTIPLRQSALQRLNMDTLLPETVSLQPFPNGVSTYHVTFSRPDGSYDIEFYCHDSQLKALVNVDWFVAFDPVVLKNLSLFSSLKLGDVQLKPVQVTHVSNDKGTVSSKAELLFPADSWSAFDEMTTFTFSDPTNDSTAIAARSMSFTLAAPPAASAVLKNTCL